MDLYAELARLTAAPELPDWVLGTVQKFIDQAQEEAAESTRLSEQVSRRDTALHAAKIQIQALTLELAHLRRMRFGPRSEALSPEERDLFQETLASDLAGAPKPNWPGNRPRLQRVPSRRRPAPRVRAPAVSRCRLICRVSSTCTNRTAAPVGSVARNWSRSARTSANNWMSSRPVSSCIGTSAHSTPAVPARRCVRHRSQRP